MKTNIDSQSKLAGAVQYDMFIKPPDRQPLVVAYGMGVDSTAALIELSRRAVLPDAILFADTGNEKDETYAYLPIIQSWLREKGFPPVTVVRYEPKKFKNYPPYSTLGENCLTNGTLPSLAFGFKSCSIKWKIAPQNSWTNKWPMAVNAWRYGMRVKKLIGYDASPKDRNRYAHAVGLEDDKYEYWYPLIEWGFDREDCKEIIRSEGLPVPPKSACYFCPAAKPDELMEYKKKYLVMIVIMEARAEPRLQKIEGLWRNGVKGTRGGIPKPGKMTEFIREEGLLPSDYIDYLVEISPKAIVQNQMAFERGLEIPGWHDFLEAFTPEDGV